MSYNILSIDGGGVFGIHAAVVLDRIVKQCPDFLDKIDLIAGTSIGGIIALGLANDFKTNEIIDAFILDVDKMFSSSTIRNISSFLGMEAYYSNDGMKSIFTKYFGDKKLSDLKKKVVIQSFQINGAEEWQGKLFHNLAKEGDASAVYAGMATTAAPIYFPSVDNFIDGGVAQNNPAITAIAMTQDKSLNLINPPQFQDIKLLSIGRIYASSYLHGKNLDWGYLKWALPLINILLTGNMTATDYQCRQLLGDRYFRVSTKMPSKFEEIDDISIVSELKTFSETIDISNLINWTKNNW